MREPEHDRQQERRPGVPTSSVPSHHSTFRCHRDADGIEVWLPADDGEPEELSGGSAAAHREAVS